MPRAIFIFCLLTGLCAGSTVRAQSTISDLPWELTSSKGVWGALLPAYELGTNSNGGTAFRDNLDDVGYYGDLKLVRRFLGTRTSFETDGFFAFAESVSKTGIVGVDVPNPSTGASNMLSGNRTHLKSKVDHYGFDIALRDTWRTRYGGLSAGAAFSYMAFDQKFDVNYGPSDLLREKLNTDFRGGKGFVGWDGCLFDRATNLDFAVGIYDMDTDYKFFGQSIGGTLFQELSKTTTTFETTFTTRDTFRGHQLGLTFGVTYLSDLPTIQHNTGTAATLDTDSAVMLTILLELLL